MQTVSFTPSERDLVEANKLWLRSELRTRGNLLYLFSASLLCGFVGAWYAAGRSFSSSVQGAATGIAVLWLLLLFIIGALRLSLPRRARQQFRQQRSIQRDAVLTWGADGLTMVTTSGYSRHTWAEFSKWAESEEIIGLFFTDRLLTFIPKRALSPDELTDLRRTLKVNLS